MNVKKKKIYTKKNGFNFQALKSFAFNFQHEGFNLHRTDHGPNNKTELMSITSNSYGERIEILNSVFDIRI